MSKKIDQFCESLRQQLTEVETKLNHTKADLETFPQQAKHLIDSKLEEAKTQLEVNKQKGENAKAKVQQFIEAKKSEIQTQVEEWKTKREIEHLVSRADRAEEYAANTLILAAVALQEAQVAVLDAIEARMAADEAVSDS